MRTSSIVAELYILAAELRPLSEFRTSKDRRDACWSKKGMVLLELDHRGHFVLVEPLRPKRRTSGGGVKKCMTYCTDVVSEDKVHGDPSIPCIVV